MKLSYEKLIQYQNLSVNWLGKNPDNIETKLGKIIKRLEKEILKLLKPVTELNEALEIKVEDARADHALTDTVTGKFIYDIVKDKEGNEQQRHAYTPALRKTRDAAIRVVQKKYEADLEILMAKEIEFDKAQYTPEVPKLTSDELEAFTGIVISPDVPASNFAAGVQ